MSFLQPTPIPIMQVRPNMLLLYTRFEWPSGRPNFSRKAPRLEQPKVDDPSSDLFKSKAAYSGQITEHSKKRLTRAINLLVGIAEEKEVINPSTGTPFKFRVNFATLTLPSPQAALKDSEIKKKCLDPWLKSMRRRHQLRSYVWRAERQYNGNVHFHITTDTWLPLDDIRDEWNHQIRKLGLLDSFKAKHGHDSPNSTDVHSVNQIANLAGYMVKYMSKEPEEHLIEVNSKLDAQGKPLINPVNHSYRQIAEQPTWDQPIDGKVWDCSLNLKQKTSCEVEADSQVECEVRELISAYKLKWKRTDKCLLIFTQGYRMEDILEGVLLQMYRDYIILIRDWQPNTQNRVVLSSSPGKIPVSNAPPHGTSDSGNHTQLELFYQLHYRL